MDTIIDIYENPIGYFDDICNRLNSVDILTYAYRDCMCLLDRIFNSSGDNRRMLDYEFIIAALQYLSFKVIVNDIEDNYDKMFCFVGGGYEHTCLSKMLLSYIDNKYKLTPEQEYRHNGKRVDIYDNENKTIYEIGNTDPSAFILHLIDPIIQNIYVIPFQMVHRYNFKKLVCINVYCNNRDKLEAINDELVTYRIDQIYKRRDDIWTLQ